MERWGVCPSTAASNPSPTKWSNLHGHSAPAVLGVEFSKAGELRCHQSRPPPRLYGCREGGGRISLPYAATSRWFQLCHCPTIPSFHLHRIQCPYALIYMVVTYSWSSTAGTHSGSVRTCQWRRLLSAMGWGKMACVLLISGGAMAGNIGWQS